MFTAMKPLLDQCVFVSITLVAGSDGTLSVTVTPKAKEGQDVRLSQPLALTATFEELDEGFTQAVLDHAGIRKTVAEQLEATKTILEAVKQDAAKSVADARKKPSKNPTSGPVIDDDDENLEDGESKPCEIPPVVPVDVKPPVDDLWA
jgi:PRTRC genetic system protein E